MNIQGADLYTSLSTFTCTLILHYYAKYDSILNFAFSDQNIWDMPLLFREANG